MAIAEGSKVDFILKKESTANTEESGSGGILLRRATATMELTKAGVGSNEKRDDFQEENYNHGTRTGTVNLQSELFSGSHDLIIAAALRRDHTSVTQITASLTISSGVMTRASGSFITDGIRTGQIVRLGNMTVSGNLNRNLRVGAVTATTIALTAVDGGTAVADDAGPNSSATIDIPGAETYIPESSHTSDTFTVERRDAALGVSDIARGLKIGNLEISAQPDSPVTFTAGGNFIDRRKVSGSQILTSPSSDSGALFSSAIGLVRIGGTEIAVVTGFNLTLNNQLTTKNVVFGNVSPDVFYGRTAMVEGSMTMLRDSITLESAFDDETEVSIELFFANPGAQPQGFFSIFLDRVKINGDNLDDADDALTVTLPFKALKPASATGKTRSVIVVQDSGATAA